MWSVVSTIQNLCAPQSIPLDHKGFGQNATAHADDTQRIFTQSALFIQSQIKCILCRLSRRRMLWVKKDTSDLPSSFLTLGSPEILQLLMQLMQDPPIRLLPRVKHLQSSSIFFWNHEPCFQRKFHRKPTCMLNSGCSHNLLCWQVSKFSSAPFAHIQLNRRRNTSSNFNSRK